MGIEAGLCAGEGVGWGGAGTRGGMLRGVGGGGDDGKPLGTACSLVV